MIYKVTVCHMRIGSYACQPVYSGKQMALKTDKRDNLTTKATLNNKYNDLYDGPSVTEKINLNLFSLPFIGQRKEIKIIFTPVYWAEKIDLNTFFPTTLEKEGKYISSNNWLPGSFSYWYGLLSLYQIEK